MATLKRETKKLLSDSNLRLLSNLIISLSNTTTSVQERCVEPYEDGKVYQSGVSLVLKNSELYFCKVTNQDATWNPLHWELIGKDINEVDLNTVKSWLNLSQEELDNLQKLLKDDQITTTSTFSSSKIYMDIQAAIDTAKTYTNNQLGKAVKPAYKVVSSTSEVTETGYFYLISNGTNYDMYVLSADGSVVSLGTSDADLTQFYDKNYIDNNFYTSADTDGKFATITTVDSKVDQTDFDNHTADTVAHMTQEEKDKLVTTDDIATSFSEKPSDKKVLSEKAISNKLATMDKECKLLYPTSEFTTLASYIDTLETDKFHFVRCTLDDAPVYNGNKVECAYMIIKHGGIYIRVIAYSMVSNQTWERWYLNGGWVTDWQRVTTTTVDDVNETEINTNNTNLTKTGVCCYLVQNGICYVSLWGIESSSLNRQVISSGMPKPKFIMSGSMCYDETTSSMGHHGGLLYIKKDGVLMMDVQKANISLYGSFSYPVAES